jgi:hypothetical protein
MLIDYEQELTAAGGQAITATAYGTKPYDQKGPADAGLGDTDASLLFKVVGADFNTLTSMDIALTADDDGAGTNEVTVLTKNFLLASLTKAAGVRRVGVVPPGTRKRFFRVKCTVNGSAPSQGKIQAWIASGDDSTPANIAFTI